MLIYSIFRCDLFISTLKNYPPLSFPCFALLFFFFRSDTQIVDGEMERSRTFNKFPLAPFFLKNKNFFVSPSLLFFVVKNHLGMY